MAVYRFTKGIHNSEKVLLSVNPGPTLQPILRDFTYIDDIIKGVVLAMEYRPSVCGEVYNLGNGHPVSLEEVLHLLEGELGMKADIVSLCVWGESSSPSLPHPSSSTCPLCRKWFP